MKYKFEIRDEVSYKVTGENLIIVNKMKDKMSNSYLCKNSENKIDVYSENDLIKK